LFAEGVANFSPLGGIIDQLLIILCLLCGAGLRDESIQVARLCNQGLVAVVERFR
jgi:hypothetical protein